MQNEKYAFPKTEVLLLIGGFYFAWGLPQCLGAWTHTPMLIQQILFSLAFAALAGTLLPLRFMRRHEMMLLGRTASPRLLLGMVVLALGLVLAIVLSGAAAAVLARAPSVPVVVRYLLLFFPMALALSLISFGIFDLLFESTPYYLAVVTFFFAAGFFIDSAFANFELALTMGILGLVFAAAHRLHGRFWLSFSALYLAMLMNTLAEGKYDTYPFWVVLAAALICFYGLYVFWTKRESKGFT